MRLVDVDSLRPYLLNEHYHYRSVYDAEEVKNAPTVDAVPIVYCKDCYWWYTCTTTDGTIDLSHCERGVSAGNGQYFYCALGQRRVNLKDGNR